MKVLIVDAEEIFRLSLREVVAIAGNFSEIIEAGSEHEFLAKTASHTDLSLVVLHPSSLTHEGEDWIKLVRRLYPGVAIVTITNEPHAVNDRWLGTATIARSASVSMMVASLRRALRLPTEGHAAGRPARPRMAGDHANEFSQFQQNLNGDAVPVDLTRLSYRQKQILAMAADGLPNKEIAARLTIAEGTVKAHMHAIFKVLGVSNRTQAVIRYGAARQRDTAPEVIRGGQGSLPSPNEHMRA